MGNPDPNKQKTPGQMGPAAPPCSSSLLNICVESQETLSILLVKETSPLSPP
jgi:hypothetical protein